MLTPELDLAGRPVWLWNSAVFAFVRSFLPLAQPNSPHFRRLRRFASSTELKGVGHPRKLSASQELSSACAWPEEAPKSFKRRTLGPTVRQYAANKVLKEVRKDARRSAKAKGIKPEQVAALVREGRK